MAATSVRARKSKGYMFQRAIANRIREVFGLQERDVVSTPSSVPGEDIILSDRAMLKFPFAIEAKRQEKISIWDSLNQMSDNAERLSRKTSKDIPGLLIFKKNYSPVYCAMEFEEFLAIYKRLKELEEQE